MVENSHPPGLLHRLFSYIMSALFPRRSKHVNLGAPGSNEITELSIAEGSSRNAEQPKFGPSKPNWDANLGSEIVVEFKHTDEMENWTHVNHVPKEDGLDQILMQKGRGTKERNRDETVQNGVKIIDRKGIQKKTDSEGQFPVISRPNDKGSRKTDRIKDAAEERERSKKKEKIIANQAEETKTKPPGRSRPLASVISNINEKSEAFIRSRKEAMRRHFSLDPEKH